MAMRNSDDRFGTLAKSLHWAGATLVLALLVSGFMAANAEESHAKAEILRIHIPVAITLTVITVARLLSRLLDRAPAPLPSPTWQRRMAGAVHLGLYMLIILMIGSGAAMLLQSGAAPAIFDAASTSLPDFRNLPPRAPHGAGGKLILLLIALHIGAVLFHIFIRRDNLFRRMWFQD